MIAACPECRTQYRVDAQQLSDEGVRLRCTRCQTIFRVRAPQAAPAEPPAPTPPPRETQPEAPRPELEVSRPAPEGPRPAPEGPRPAPEGPRPAPEAETPRSGVQRPPASPAETTPLSERLVLVATPDADNAKAWGEAVQGWGLEVETAHDGVEAILKIHRRWPTAVVLDPQLPKMFGFQVCEVIKRNDTLRRIGVVLIGAIHHPQRYRRSPSELYGADAYVEEPDMPEALAPILRDLGLPLGPAAVSAPAPADDVSAPSSPPPAHDVSAPSSPPPAADAPTVPPPIPPEATLPPTPARELAAPAPTGAAEAAAPPPVPPAPEPAPSAPEITLPPVEAAPEPPQPEAAPEPSSPLEASPEVSLPPMALSAEPSPAEASLPPAAPVVPEVPHPPAPPMANEPPAAEAAPAIGSPEYDVVDPDALPAAEAVREAEPAPAAPSAPPASAPEPAPAVDPEVEQAERLARIIISDVVLYNEEKFRAACEAGNVLEALEADMADGRAHFASRVPEHVRNTRDFLADELMRVARSRGLA